jgi:hypothetical protein
VFSFCCCASYKASGKTVQKQVLSQTGMFWHPIFICRLSLSHTEHRWSCCCCSSTLSWCQGRREEEEEEGGGGGRTPAPKTCIISREMHIIGSVVPNWGEENAGMVPVGSNWWCDCIFWNGWGEQVRDNVASSSHHRGDRRKMELKKNYLSNRNYFCLIMQFLFYFCFIQLKNIIALQKTSVVALDKEY